jgi:AAA+ superfamily predicted ATPase
MMFTGAPGVGKTLAARWVAEKLELPLVTMSLAATVSSHLGTSGKNVKAVLDYAQSAPCVLFIDEFDAIAKNRDDETDVGELKRIVNVVLMELDRWPSSTLLLVATNHAHLLDPAIRRRFDTILQFDFPDRVSRQKLFSHLGGIDRFPESFYEALADSSGGWTGSDIERLWNASSRRSVLRSLPLDQMLGEDISRQAADEGRPEASYRLLSEQLGWSNRKIAAHVGVTHPTVASALKRVE